MKNSKLRSQILQISEGVLANITDVILFQIYFGLATATSGGGPNSRKVWRDYYDAEMMLSELNYDSLKRALYRLKSQNLIEYVKEESITIPKVTKLGWERLKSTVPKYQAERPWDGKIYLITYDIPENRKGDREKLRQQIRKLGCGMLQASVWLTLYNPREILKELVAKENLEGSIIVSAVGRDGNIGQTDLKDLTAEIYNLYELNERYQEFLEKYHSKKTAKNAPTQVALDYLAILKDDPQLPFELLPRDWQGDEAYTIFRRLTAQK